MTDVLYDVIRVFIHKRAVSRKHITDQRVQTGLHCFIT